MYLIKKLKVLFLILCTIFFYIKISIAFENKILFKVDSEIITTIDIYEEIKFLKIFKPEMKNLDEKRII